MEFSHYTSIKPLEQLACESEQIFKSSFFFFFLEWSNFQVFEAGFFIKIQKVQFN